MSVVYLDTSALVKRYVAEPGSEWVQDLLNYSETPSAFGSSPKKLYHLRLCLL